MRVTGGRLRGRSIRVPAGKVRPTTDRVREALFALLGARIAGARVLDLFAGSGALGLEAWSRGALGAWWVERDARVFRVLQENVRRVCGDGAPDVRCVRSEAGAFLRAAPAAAGVFDGVFLDPPYEGAGTGGAAQMALRALHGSPMLRCGGWVALELSARGDLPPLEGWDVGKDRTYGETRILLVSPCPSV